MELLAQTDPSQTDWVAVTRDLGFPIAMALLLLLFGITSIGGIGAAMWRIGIWFAPIVEKVATKHVNLMDTLEENSTKTTYALETLSATQRSSESTQSRTTRALEELSDTQKKIADTQTAILTDLSKQTSLQEQLNAKVDSKFILAIQTNSLQVPLSDNEVQELAAELDMEPDTVARAAKRFQERRLKLAEDRRGEHTERRKPQ